MGQALLSIVYLTYKPGGIDLLVESLLNQEPNYELIVIDDMSGRAERGKAEEYIRTAGLNLSWYGPSKTKLENQLPHGLANAMNTGALVARCSHIIYVHDFSYLLPGQTTQWVIAFSNNPSNSIIQGMASIHVTPEPEEEGDISIWAPTPGKYAQRFGELLYDWKPEVYENFYCGVPIQYMEDANGINEQADGDIAWPLSSMAQQAKHLGYNFIINDKLRILMADHRSWKSAKGVEYHAENKAPRNLEEPYWPPRGANRYMFTETRKNMIHPFEDNLAKRLSSGPKALTVSQPSQVPPALTVPARPIIRVTQGGMQFDFFKDDFCSRLLMCSQFCSYDLKLMKLLIRPGDTVLDVGANIGYLTTLFSQLVGNQGRVFAFEPDPDNFYLINRNIKLGKLTNVLPVCIGLGSEDATQNFYLSRSDSGDGRLWQAKEGMSLYREMDAGRKVRPVNIMKLDNVLKDDVIVDFIKVDTQGYETFVLQGGRETIARQESLLLFLEFWPDGMIAAGSSVRELVECLKGFAIFGTMDKGRLDFIGNPEDLLDPALDASQYPNLLCVKGSVSERVTKRMLERNFCGSPTW